MSYTLLLRLDGPMQAWGADSRFAIRETHTEPTKSGVIGLLCAALGWDRAASSFAAAGRTLHLSDLAALPFGVRVEREGILRRDYHTAQHVLKASARLRPGKAPSASDLKLTELSERFYLADARFVVGLQSDDLGLLSLLDEALAHPHWPLALGRKSFPPALPVRIVLPNKEPAIFPVPLAEALLTFDDPITPRSTRAPMPRVILDADADAAPLVAQGYGLLASTVLTDLPLSFHPRRFAPREARAYVSTGHAPEPSNAQPA